MNELFDRLTQFPQTQALVLGGSRAGKYSDAVSDYDVYLYVSEPIPEEERTALYELYCSRYETGNHYFEYEDNCYLKDGTGVDIIFRRFEDIEQYLHHVVDEGNAFNAYTTCFWHNIITAEILYDRDGTYARIQQQYKIPYPRKLRDAVIRRNMNLLTDALPAFDKQILKAVDRGDIVSIHHRATEFLASYFDVIFAMNEKTHPGEKRLISLCRQQCRILPAQFEENLTALLQELYAGKEIVEQNLERILSELKKALRENGMYDTEE